jgi:BirA family biotin operon repressor/biotin-[acetyl-CoA-carboxylase] ligase
MTTKEKVLAVLEARKGQSISGAELARALNISRNSVWKAINSLRSEGYRFAATPNRGYCLLEENDIISQQSVQKHLKNIDFFRLTVVDRAESTNTVLKQLAEGGEAEGRVVIANEQTSGRGRMGRRFYSPPGSGIYISLLLRPKLMATDALFITTAAAVAVSRAIEAVTGKASSIKWVNDIYCGDKKVCGILTEASIDFESGGLSYAVLGIGINIGNPDGGFPEELKDIATSIYGGEPYSPEIRSELAAGVLDNFLQLYKELHTRSFMVEYRSRSFVIGKEVLIIRPNSREQGIVLDIDDEARLVVKTAGGEIKKLSSGEISIREKKTGLD